MKMRVQADEGYQPLTVDAKSTKQAADLFLRDRSMCGDQVLFQVGFTPAGQAIYQSDFGYHLTVTVLAPEDDQEDDAQLWWGEGAGTPTGHQRPASGMYPTGPAETALGGQALQFGGTCPDCGVWKCEGCKNEDRMRCRYCGEDATYGVCDACERAQTRSEADEDLAPAARNLGRKVDWCQHDFSPWNECPQCFPPKKGTGPLVESTGQAITQSVKRQTDRLFNSLMDQADELAAGPIPASEGASDQGGTAWLTSTFEHLKRIGFIPANAELVLKSDV
jgi:hypothetical protein